MTIRKTDLIIPTSPMKHVMEGLIPKVRKIKPEKNIKLRFFYDEFSLLKLLHLCFQLFVF